MIKKIKSGLENLGQYLPGIILILLGFMVIYMPMILVFVVASILMLAGTLYLTIMRNIVRQEVEAQKVRQNFYEQWGRRYFQYRENLWR